MKSSLIQAILFSLVVHLVVIGGVFTYLEFQKKQALKQGYFAADYGFEIAGGTITSLLTITFIVLTVLYLVIKWVISKFY